MLSNLSASSQALLPLELMMHYSNQDEIKAIILAFEDCSLPRSQWTHVAHLTVAFWYLVHHPKSEAVRLIREGIQRYNTTMDIPQTITGGYHETITLFWVEVVDPFRMAQPEDNTLLQQTNALLQHFNEPHLPLRYYSRDRLMSWQARTTLLQPDLKQINPILPLSR